MRFVLILLSVLLALPAAANQQVPQSRIQIDMSFAPVVKAAKPAVVNIYTKKLVTQRVHPLFADPFFEQFFGTMPAPTRQRVQNSLGSGVIVSPEGLVVTNAHVAKEADEIRVVLDDRREFSATLALVDEKTDLALLKIEGANEKFPVLQFGNSDTLEVGDLVLAIGNPFGIGQTVTSGIVSALARTNVGPSGYGYYIQTDAAINPGNSGGALMNLNGEVVGINTMIFSKTGGYMGIGFAVPSNLVRQTILAYQQGGTLRRPYLGASLQNMTADAAESLGMEVPRGVLIKEVFPGTPAARAGLRRGDVLVMFGEKIVEDIQTLRYLMATHMLGDKVIVSVLRKDGYERLPLRLEAPSEKDMPPVVKLEGDHPLNGAAVQELSPALIEEMGEDAPPPGSVLLHELSPLAARLGLRPGDRLLSVNGTRIENVAQLRKILAKRGKGWVMQFARNGQTLTLRVQ